MATFDGISLIDALKWGEDEESLGWIETIIAGDPLFELLPQKRITGRVFIQEHEDTLPNVQFRNLNETYTPSEGVNDDSMWGTTILGGELRVDIAVDSFADQAELESDQYAKHAKSAAMRHTFESINGTGSVASKGFAGLKQLVTNGWGIQNDQTDAILNFDHLDRSLLLMENGEADFILCNKEVALQFSLVARDGGSNSFSYLGTSKDILDRTITTYKGIPIRVLRRGRNSSGATADIFPFTETGNTSSMYLVRAAKDAVCGLLGNGGSMHMRPLGESTEGPYKTGRLEFYPGLASFDPYGLIQYSGILAA